MSDAIHDEAFFATLGSVHAALAGIVDKELLSKRMSDLTTRCTEIARGAVALYVVNRQLYVALRDLERLASSWSGNPEANAAIRRARETLQSFRADAATIEQVRGAAWYLLHHGAPPL